MALKKPSSGPPREDPQQYLAKKNYKKAIEIYRAQVKEDPEDPNLSLRLADSLVLDGQTQAAVSEYKRAATLYGDQGFLLKAIGVNKKIVRLDPSQREVHQNLSKLYEERGLLASPASAAAPARSAGNFQFDMEEAASDAPAIDIGGGMSPVVEAEGQDQLPAELPDPDHELGAGDVDFAHAPEPVTEAPAPESEPVPESGFTFGFSDPAPAAAESHAAELSVDALGDALASDQDFASDALGVGDSTLAGLAGELGPDAVAPTTSATLAPDKVPLFSDFTPDEFVEVVNEMDERSFRAGDVIVREGDPGDALFVLVSGKVRVSTTMKGREIQLAELKEGDFFGEGSLITGRPRTATVIALEDGDLLSLNRSALATVVDKHPRVMDVMKHFYQQRAESTVRSVLKSGKK